MHLICPLRFCIVVMKMGSLAQSSNHQNCIKSTNKIPEYAREYKKEWLFIRGINKELDSFIRIHDPEGKKFSSPKADRIKYIIKRFLKGQENGRLKKDISHLLLKKTDVNSIDFLEEFVFDNYGDLFYEFEEYPRYINEYDKNKFYEFVESFNKLKKQLKTDSNSDSDSDIVIIFTDSDSDIEDDNIILPDSDSDSDREELDTSYTDSDIEDFTNILNSLVSNSDSDSDNF